MEENNLFRKVIERRREDDRRLGKIIHYEKTGRKKDIFNIGFIGLGNVGRAIADRFSIIDPNLYYDINLFLTDIDYKKTKSLRGALWKPTRSKRIKDITPLKIDEFLRNINAMDIIYFSASKGFEKNRILETEKNLDLIKEYAPQFKENFEGNVVVVSNLTDILSYVFALYSKVDPRRIIGLNHTDTLRLQGYIEDRLRKDGQIEEDVSKIPIKAYAIGSHEKPWCVLYNVSAAGVKITDKLVGMIKEINNKIRGYGPKQMKTLGTTAIEVDDAALDVGLSIMNEDRIVVTSTIYPPLNKEAYYVGLPVIFKNHYPVGINYGKWFDSLSEMDRKEFDKSLEDVIGHINKFKERCLIDKGDIVMPKDLPKIPKTKKSELIGLIEREMITEFGNVSKEEKIDQIKDESLTEVLKKAEETWEKSIESGDLDLKEPIRMLEEALKSYPNSEEIRRKLVLFYDLSVSDLNNNLILKTSPQKIKLVKELISLNPTNPRYFCDLAEIYSTQEKFKEAEDMLKRGIKSIKRVLEEKPKDEDLIFNLIQAHVNFGDFYAEGVPDRSYDPFLHLPGFEEFPESERQNPNRAIQEYEIALGIMNKNKIKVRYSIKKYEFGHCSIEEKLATLYKEKENRMAAVCMLENLIEKMTSDNDSERAYKREVYKKIGNIFKEEGNYKRAINYYEKGLAVEIKDFEFRGSLKRMEAYAVYYIGECYQGMRKHRKAIETFRGGLELGPDDEGVLALLNFALGYSSDKIGDLQEAAYYYRKVIEINPKEKKVYNNLGLIYSKLGFRDKAIKEFREALIIDSNYGLAKDNLNIELGR